MEPILSKKEQSVVEFLAVAKVATKNILTLELHLSPITVCRALKKYGYYSSYNYNAAYYTLKDIPQFNDYGLWKYGDIGFAKYPNINETMVAIINQSVTGYTTTEMNRLLGTETKNLLSRLRTQQRLGKFYLGHQGVYSSMDPTRQASQQESRQKQQVWQLEQEQKRHWQEVMLPDTMDARTIIQVLIGMIQTPQASIASLSRHLQVQDVKVTAEAIQTIISFYGLEKKTAR